MVAAPFPALATFMTPMLRLGWLQILGGNRVTVAWMSLMISTVVLPLPVSGLRDLISDLLYINVMVFVLSVTSKNVGPKVVFP